MVICKLKNTFSFQSYLHQLGQKNVYDPEFSYHIPVDVFQASLERLGKVKRIAAIPFGLAPDQQEALKALLPDELGNKQETVNRLSCKEYLFVVEKGT